MDISLFFELQQYKRFAVAYLNRFLMTPEDQIEECFPYMLVNQKINELIQKQLEHLPMILPMIQFQVGATPLAIHSYNVSSTALIIGHELGIKGKELHNLFIAALAHDVGKMFISNYILDKPGKLAPAESLAMKQHPELGALFLQSHYPQIPEDVVSAVLQHHEIPDGSGYHGCKDNEINKYAKIIRTADVFSAAVEERTYHPARSLQDGYNILAMTKGIDLTHLMALNEYIHDDVAFDPNIIY